MGEPIQNFGDYICEYLARTLFYPFRSEGEDVFLVGSVIDNIFVPPSENGEDYPPITFWGCGVREPGGLSPDRLGGIRVLATRGPLSSSELGLGDDIPQGDPGFLLPALYQPKILPHLTERSICIPHFNDTRPDGVLLEISGCDVVVRTNIENSESAFLDIVDKINSSDFILSASLHGAIVAAAYGKPFSFWDSGTIDIPFKWEDIARSMNIDSTFSSDLKSAKNLYYDTVKPRIILPSLWNLMKNPPFLVRPSGLLKVFLNDARSYLTGEDDKRLRSQISDLEQSSQKYEDIFAEILNQIKQKQLDAENRENDLKKMKTSLESSENKLKEVQAILEEREATLLKMTHEALETNRELRETHHQLKLTNQQLDCADQQLELANQKALAQDVAARAASDKIMDLKSSVLLAEADRDAMKANHNAALGRIVELEHLHSDAASYNIQLRRAYEKIQRDIHWQQTRSRRPRRFLAIAWMRLTGKERRLRLKLARSGLFDTAWYRRRYLDVQDAGARPLSDFIRFGASEQRNPHWLFDTAWYLSRYPDTVESNLNPVIHYTRHGAKRGIDPSPLFDGAWYLAQNPDVRASGTNPLLHYIRHGSAEGRSPHPLFDAAWYFTQNPDVLDSGMPPLAHFLEYGAIEQRDPSPHFNIGWYLRTNPDVRESGMNPLLHYILYGGREKREPNPNFSTPAYIAAHPDAAECQQGALYHYLVYGDHAGPADHGEQNAKATIYEDGERRILMIDSIYPTPDRDSGSVDAINFIRIFQQIGYDVYFMSTSEFGLEAWGDSGRDLITAGVRIISKQSTLDPAEFIRMNGKNFDIYFLSRVHAGGQFHETIRSHAPSSRIIFNTVDLHFRREMREAQLRVDRLGANLAYRTAARELYLCRQADATIVVSAEEVKIIEQQAPGSRIFEIPLIRDIPGRKADFVQRSGIGFIGGYNHKPNVDAVLFFLDEIWPLIVEARPDAIFHLMGADMPAEL